MFLRVGSGSQLGPNQTETVFGLKFPTISHKTQNLIANDLCDDCFNGQLVIACREWVSNVSRFSISQDPWDHRLLALTTQHPV